MRDGNKKLDTLNIGQVTEFPRVIEIQTTTVCNARCVTCPYESVYGNQAGIRMNNELLWRILNECKNERIHISQIVPYHNNEPTSDKRIFDILRYITNEIEVPVELSTNASLINDDEKAKMLVSGIGAGTLRISYFGSNRDTYERRMKRLDWEKTNENIHRILSAKNKLHSPVNVELVMIATAGLTQEEVESLRFKWSSLGVQIVVFGYLDRAGNMNTKNPLPILAKTGYLGGCDLNRPFERINITANGKAVLCSQDWKAQVVLGDLNSHSIREVWNSDEYNKTRRMINGTDIAHANMLCRTCKLAIIR